MVATFEIGKTYVISESHAGMFGSIIGKPFTIIPGDGFTNYNMEIGTGQLTGGKASGAFVRVDGIGGSGVFVRADRCEEVSSDAASKQALTVESHPLTPQEIESLSVNGDKWDKVLEDHMRLRVATESMTNKWTPKYRWPCWHDWVKKDPIKTGPTVAAEAILLGNLAGMGIFAILSFGLVMFGFWRSSGVFGALSFMCIINVIFLGIFTYPDTPLQVYGTTAHNRQCTKCGRIRLDALRYQEPQKRKQERKAERERHKHLMAEGRRALETEVMASIDRAIAKARKAG